MKEFNVIICGSREWTDYDLLKQKCDAYLKNKLSDPDTKVIIVSGCARGADTLGEEYAKERGLEVKKFPAKWDKYGKRAGYLRNMDMAEVGNAVIAFYSATSENKGTKMMVRIGREKHLLIREVYDKKLQKETSDNSSTGMERK